MTIELPKESNAILKLPSQYLSGKVTVDGKPVLVIEDGLRLGASKTPVSHNVVAALPRADGKANK
jgi:hypothetical protein